MLRASVGWWQYPLINEQLTTSSHNYSFRIIKLGTLNVKHEPRDFSNRPGIISVEKYFLSPHQLQLILNGWNVCLGLFFTAKHDQQSNN